MDRSTVKGNLRETFSSVFNFLKGHVITRALYSGLGSILLFHRVCAKPGVERISGCNGLEITPEDLERIIIFFSEKSYTFISLDKLAEHLQKKQSSGKFIVFTFDDGYADNFTYAYPVFKKYNIPFTIYVTTGFPDRKAVLWWYLLEELVRGRECINFESENKKFEFICSSQKEKEDAFWNIRNIITGSSGNNYASNINKIFLPYFADIHKKTEELTLNWDQICQLNKDPLVTIGAHSVNHMNLSKISRSILKSEMMDSKKKIESHINCEVRHFSYPYGHRGEAEKREFKMAKQCGFLTSTTTRSANIFSAHKDHMECLPRVDMSPGIDDQGLNFLKVGLTHCIRNRGKRVVTV